MDVAAPDIEVIKSKPDRDKSAVITKKITKYKYIKEIIDDIQLSEEYKNLIASNVKIINKNFYLQKINLI